MTDPGAVVTLIERQGPSGDTLVCSVTRRNRPGNLSLIGGSIEPTDRTPYDAMVRETLEESGVRVLEAEKVFERVDATDGKVAWCYRVSSFEGEPRTVEDGIEVSWVKPADLLTPECTFAEYNRLLFTHLGII